MRSLAPESCNEQLVAYVAVVHVGCVLNAGEAVAVPTASVV